MDKILQMLKNEPIKVGQFAGLTKLTDLNNQWLKDFLYKTDDQTLQAHRGSYKTTTLACFLAIHTITRPNENVMLFRKTDGDVVEILRQTRMILEAPTTQYIAERIYGTPLVLTVKTQGAIHTNFSGLKSGALQIIGLGINTSITGKHADIVITDDIVNIKDRVSASERESTKLAYQEMQNIKNRGGRFINTGTPWHKEDCFTLMPEIRKFSWQDTGLISREDVEKIRNSMTPSLFAANYELVHIADADALFTNPQFFNFDDYLYDSVCHVDAAYSTTGDGTAFTIAKQDGDTIYMLGKRWNKHVDDCLQEMYYLMDKFRAGTLFMEYNGDKGYLAREVASDNRPCQTYHESMNKYVKISTYLRSNWNRIKWHEDTDEEYINEILDYTENAAHDDAPDSAASLLREMSREITYNPLEGGI